MTEQQYLLICLAEECNEVAQRISKALRFGMDEVQPGQELTNHERINLEFVDLIATASLLDIPPKIDNEAVVNKFVLSVAAKKRKLAKYLVYSRQLGIVEGPSVFD